MTSSPAVSQKAEPHLRGGMQPLSNFEAALGLPANFVDREGGSDDENFLEAVRWLANDKAPNQNFWPALCLAYIVQAEKALAKAEKQSVVDPFVDFNRQERSSRGRAVNTLNFIVEGKKFPSRPAYNDAAEVIRVKMRREHPSAAPHATQSWRDYRSLIKLIYRMSPAARTRFAEHIWEHGVLNAPELEWGARDAKRVVRPFEYVLAKFDTTQTKRGGALFQALAYGYFSADSPNLTLESHSVNTGSSRAAMPGDVAGFRGGEVELAVEVKDFPLTSENVEGVLADFLQDYAKAPNATAVVAAAEVDPSAADRLAKSNVIALSRQEMRNRVMIWDLPKQQEALRGALYYLRRIQKTKSLYERLETFLEAEGISSGILDQPAIEDSTVPVPEEN